MGRIRTIKPEFWTSEQVVECSPSARLLFIGLWNFCDDGGIHPASLKRLKMEVFPGDAITEKQLQSHISELQGSGLIQSYTVNGSAFWFVSGWRHQKIEKPTHKYPGPEQADVGSLTTHENSPTARLPVADHSTPEGKVREGKVIPPKSPKGELWFPVPVGTCLDVPDFKSAWTDWQRFRKEKRAKLTATTAAAQLGEFQEWGVPRSIAAIRFTIKKGWTGIQEPTDRSGKPAESPKLAPWEKPEKGTVAT